jgi:Ca2+-binding EF-hand superfamily protein
MSATLGLNLSEEEVEEVYKIADINHDGVISYKEFIPVIKKVLKMVYKRSTVDWNDWCKVCDDEMGMLC